MKIKICGITNLEDALNATALGVTAIGFIFYNKSPRYVRPEVVQEIIVNLPPFVKTVGVFVDQSKSEIEAIVKQCKLDVVQLHGSESPTFCLSISRPVIKAFSIGIAADLNALVPYKGVVSAFLLDSKVPEKKGGSGESFDWGLALHAKSLDMPIILAGGIQSVNIKKAIKLVNPYAIDLASGVEKEPGVKDYNKMEEIIEIARSY